MDKQAKDNDSDESMESDNEESAAMANENTRNNIGSLTLESRTFNPLSVFNTNSDMKTNDPELRCSSKTQFKNFYELSKKLSQMNNLTALELTDCSILKSDNEVLPPISTLKELTFINCSSDIFQAFSKQNSLEKITVLADDHVRNVFPHDIFNKMCENSEDLKHIVIKGAHYFNYDEFLYKITILETSVITFNWFVGLTKARLNFLESQKGSLKELTIHELPYDFDGGEVLKFIINEMNLDTFYYGNISLILNGQKQKVKEFAASEIQITSAYEMLRQFPSIEKFRLKLSSTDISSESIEKIINKSINLFDNIKEFEVIDNTSKQGIFGLFLGLYKQLKNLRKLTLRTQNKNINKIFEELPIMQQLEEIRLTSTAPNALERYRIIKQQIATNLKIIRVADNNVDEARDYFGDGINVAGIDDANAQLGGNNQQGNEGANEPDNGSDDDDDQEDGSYDRNEGFESENVIQGNIIRRTEPSPVQTSFEDQTLNEDVTCYKIHAFGYYRNILILRNARQMERLLEELNLPILGLRTEQGKIVVQFRNNTPANLNLLREKLQNFAFIQMNKTAQLPLILSSNILIRVSCVVVNRNWNRFITRINHPGGLSSSHWTHHETEEILVGGERRFRITFNVDALSYTKMMNNLQLSSDGNIVTIDEVNNPYTHDIQLIPV